MCTPVKYTRVALNVDIRKMYTNMRTQYLRSSHDKYMREHVKYGSAIFKVTMGQTHAHTYEI